MPVPNSMQDLAQLAGSNSPAGTEAIGNSLDNYLRAHASIIRSTNALASASIASASTTDVGLADGESVLITGTTTITSLGTGFAGCYRELRFSGILTITHSANLQLPYTVNVVTAVGDAIAFRCLSAGVWVMVSKSRVSGGDVTSSLGYVPANKAGDTFTGGVTFNSAANVAGALVTRKADNDWAMEVQTTAGVNLGGVWVDPAAISLIANGTSAFKKWDFRDDGDAVFPGAITIGGGRKISKVTVSSSAPGALADGELYLRY